MRLRPALCIVSALAVLAGLIFAEQGIGYIPYPAGSLMINDIAWAYRGGALAAAGFAGIVFACRRARRR